MWQKQNKDNRIFRLAVASLLASNAVIILSVTVIEFTRAESTHISTTFELPKNVPMGTKVRIYSSSSMNAINKALQSNFEKQFSKEGNKFEKDPEILDIFSFFDFLHFFHFENFE